MRRAIEIKRPDATEALDSRARGAVLCAARERTPAMISHVPVAPETRVLARAPTFGAQSTEARSERRRPTIPRPSI